MIIRLILVLFAGMIFSGCATTYSDSEREKISSEPTPEELLIQVDPLISSMLNTYRDSLNSVIGIKVATVMDTLTFGKPESSLGNLVSDALRYRAARETGNYINIGIIGEDSFRLFLLPGELTYGEVMEFMPYDNHLVILTLTGSKIRELTNQVAALGGAPISGLRFRIDQGRAQGILVNSQVLNPNQYYTVATSSWVANGGDKFPAIWDYSDRLDLVDVDVRELYLNYFESRRVISPVLDGRIR